jgi:hypothetical protein
VDIGAGSAVGVGAGSAVDIVTAVSDARYAELAAAAERVRAAHDRLGSGPEACAELLEAERAYLELRAEAREFG